VGLGRQPEKRRDVNQSNLTEEFFYDNLYRLGSSTLNGVTNLTMTAGASRCQEISATAA
jgi:hypothetical protein